jgi:hypothetical protein
VSTIGAYAKGAALLGHGAQCVVLVAQIVDATVRRAITERASKKLKRDYCSLKLIAREKTEISEKMTGAGQGTVRCA